MALKRKASFTTIVSSSATPSLPGAVAIIDEPPKHLNSRTRKRFRNDRPDDQTVYENTLRWLFSAQQRQQPSSLPVDESMPPSPQPLEPEPIDPRQQTLHKFFKSTRTVSSSTNTSSVSQQKESMGVVNGDITQGHATETGSTISSAESGSGSPNSQIMDIEMDME